MSLLPARAAEGDRIHGASQDASDAASPEGVAIKATPSAESDLVHPKELAATEGTGGEADPNTDHDPVDEGDHDRAVAAEDDREITADLARLATSAGEAHLLAALPPGARGEMFDPDRLSRVYEAAAPAANTRRMYRSRFELFVAWCLVRGLRPAPAHPEVLRLYLLCLAEEKKSLSTIQVSAAAIVKVHRVLGDEVPTSTRLRVAVRHLRRTLGAAGRRRTERRLPVPRKREGKG